jgi:protein-S-isoprenylcysteine O-methyltransferase Ste14
LRVLSVVATVAAALGMIGLWQQHALLAHGWPALTIQAAAILLMLWARWTFGRRSFHLAANPTAGGLVTSGPYRYVRHPIYGALLYFAWAAALTHRAPLPLAAALVITGGLALRMRAEECLVELRYPEYRAYAARTRRILPGVL